MCRLHTIQGKPEKNDCGLAVLSAISGRTIQEIARIMNRYPWNGNIGVSTKECLGVLKILGFDSTFFGYFPGSSESFCGFPAPLKKIPTLSRWVKSTSRPDRCILALKNHWIAFSDNYFSDNGVMYDRIPTHIRDIRHNWKSRVHGVLTIK